MAELKPPYRVPSMAEIAKVKPNGLKVISTFSGCGGSSLGFRMVGFKVLWASEFIDAARAVYEANAAPGTVIDGRDIREVDPLDVLRTLGLRPGEVDVLEGSPPCASFSTAGKRDKHWGATKKYSDKTQRTDDLFFEYVRFLKAIQPRVFVAENVSGLVKGVAKGYFLEILAAMKSCGYLVEARLLDAQWLGVPQARQRIIFVGTRLDLGVSPVHPSPLPYRYSVLDALPSMRDGEIVSIGGNGQFGETKWSSPRLPARTIGAGPTTGNGRAAGGDLLVKQGAKSEKRKFTIAELKRICSFPDDFKLSGNYVRDWERLGRAVPPIMMKAIALKVAETLAQAPSRTGAPAPRSRVRSTTSIPPRGAGRTHRSRPSAART